MAQNTNNEQTWNIRRTSRTKRRQASYGKPVLSAAFLLFLGHLALNGAGHTAKASPASFPNVAAGMPKSTRRRGVSGHGPQVMAYRLTPAIRAVRHTTNRTACTRFFQVATNQRINTTISKRQPTDQPDHAYIAPMRTPARQCCYCRWRSSKGERVGRRWVCRSCWDEAARKLAHVYRVLTGQDYTTL